MRKIYIDLDSLLDTRLGTVSKLNPEAAIQAIQGDRYWDREHTDWHELSNGYLSNEQFNDAWEHRDKETLRESVMTSILAVLGRVLAEYHQNMKEGMATDEVAVEVNVAPYPFDDEEMEELAEILKLNTYKDLPVFFISRPLDELTPEFIREHYDAMILFEFHRWVRLQHVALTKCHCRDVTFIVPRLFERKPERLTDEQKRDEFVAFRLGFLDHLELEFVDPAWFSMFRPMNKPPE